MNSKRGLGRGLDALLSVGRDFERGENLLQVPVNAITANPFQPRREFDQERLQDLADSIKLYGVLQPIVVRLNGDGYQLVTGERRWRASQMAGLRELPAVIREYSDTEMTAVALVENLQRENLNPIEEAVAYRRLIDEFGFTQEEVSEKVGRSRPFIANTVRLLNLPASVQEYVSRGTMTPGQARPLLVLPTAAMQVEAATEIVSKALTARGAEELAKKWSNRKSTGQVKKRAETAGGRAGDDVKEQLSRLLGTKVEVDEREDGTGMIKIEFYSTEELQRLFDLISGVAEADSGSREKRKPGRFSV
jgi:ParB family chromosome partitioning protein